MRKELDGTLFRRASTIYSGELERKYNFHSIFDSCLLGTRSFYIKSPYIWYSCDNIIFLVKGYLISAKWSRIGFEWVVIYNELMSSLQLYMRFWQNILALNICKLGNKCCFWSRHLTALVSSLLNKQSRLVMRLITHYCFLTIWTSKLFSLRRKMIKKLIQGQILFSFPSMATGMYWLRLCLFFPSEQNVWHVKQISPRLMATSTCLDTHDDAAALKLLEKMPLKNWSVRLTKKRSF